MGKLRAERTDWYSAAWAIKLTLTELRTAPSESALRFGSERSLDVFQVHDLEWLQDAIRRHVNYRMCQRQRSTKSAVSMQLPLTGRDPDETQRQRDSILNAPGVAVSAGEMMAFEAHILLGKILQLQGALPQWVTDLPLMVATIPQATPTNPKSCSGIQGRRGDRRGRLRTELESAIRNHPGESARALLDQLSGSDVVVRWSADQVWYHTGKEIRRITMDRYENTFSEANRSITKHRARTK